MRITKTTPLDELWKLRRSFAPRWASESAKVKEARGKLKGDELERAEQAYADFETVATSVIAITELRQDYEKAQEELAGVGVAQELGTVVASEDAIGERGRFVSERKASLDAIRGCLKAMKEKSMFRVAHDLEHAIADASVRSDWAEWSVEAGKKISDEQAEELKDDKVALMWARDAILDDNKSLASEFLNRRMSAKRLD